MKGMDDSHSNRPERAKNDNLLSSREDIDEIY